MGTKRHAGFIVKLLAPLVLLLVATIAQGATVSGTVTNNSGKSGRIYLSGQWSGGGNVGWGVSIPAGTTNYTIRGVPDGDYRVKAFLDTQASGSQHANDPVGYSAQFAVSGGVDPAAVSVTLNNPTPVPLQPPKFAGVVSGNGVVLVTYDVAQDQYGNEIDTSYKAYWSTSPDPGPALGHTIGGGSSPALGGGDSKGFIRAFANGTKLYFAVTATLDGVESAPLNANNGEQLTIGAPAGGVTVSGTVTVPASGVGKPLFLALGGNNGPPPYIAMIAHASASTPYSITGVQPGNYGIYTIVDMNNNGSIDVGDIANTDGNGTPITVADVPVTSDVTLAASNANITVRTDHWRGEFNEGYGLNLEVRQQLKRPVNVAVTGPQLGSTPLDIGLRDRGSFSLSPSLSGRPSLLDSYQFAITYSDGTTTNASPLNASITGIVDSFPPPVSPVGYVHYPFTPQDFTWGAPVSPPTPHTIAFMLNNVQNFNYDNYGNLPGITTTVNYPYDYADGNSYDWQVAVVDRFGNDARSQVYFTPTSSPAINGFSPKSGVPGTTVTITGINFDANKDNNQVHFPGNPEAAPVVSATTTQLVVTVPGGGSAASGPIQMGSQSGQSRSNFAVDIDQTAPTTTATPGGGLYPLGVDVTLTSNEPATIYYTTNGSDPTIASPSFFVDAVGNVPHGPVHISKNSFLRYFAKDLSGNSEAIKQQAYAVGAQITLTLDTGGISSITIGNSVTATATIVSGAGPTGTIQFIVDGTPYGLPVALSGTTASILISGLPVSATPHDITAVYNGDDTYAIKTSNVKQVTVNKTPQDIIVNTPAPPSATYNSSFVVAATAPGGTVSYSSDNPFICTNVGSTFTMVSGSGTCIVRYDQPGTATIAPAARVTNSVAAQKVNQTITVTTPAPASKAYNAAFTVAATSDSGLPVTYSSGSTDVCTNVGPVFTMVSGSGTCIVRYDQAGSANYSPAVQVSSSNTAAAKADQAITFAPLTVKAYGDLPFNPGATANSGLAVSYSSSDPTVATGSGSTVTILSVGTTTITANQPGNGNYNAATAVTQLLTVKQPIRFSSTITSVTTVPVTLEYAGAVKMQFLIDKAAAWTALAPFVATKTITVPAGNGLKTVSVRFVDAQGKASPIFTASIFLDAAAPVGTISIENGAASTNSTLLNLSLTASDSDNGALQMRFSENGTSWSSWAPYATTTLYTLGTFPQATVTPGLKKVYVQFSDAAGKLSKSYFDTITYLPPAVSSTKSSISINDGSSFTTSTAVKLTLTAPGGQQYVHLSSNGTTWGAWLPVPALPMNWVLTASNGVKTVYAQYSSDKVTPSPTYSADITLDTIAPVGWLLINNGAAVAGSRNVNLTMGATDVNGVAKMCLKETSVACTEGEFVDFAPSRNNYTIQSPGDGAKSIYISFRDNAGKVSKPLKAAITLDTLAPTGTIVINGGKPTTTTTTVPLKLTAVRAVYMQISTDGGATWGEWEAYATAKTVVLPAVPGLRPVKVRFKDFAGNASTTYSATVTLLQ